jgi:hypothetical protein
MEYLGVIDRRGQQRAGGRSRRARRGRRYRYALRACRGRWRGFAGAIAHGIPRRRRAGAGSKDDAPAAAIAGARKLSLSATMPASSACAACAGEVSVIGTPGANVNTPFASTTKATSGMPTSMLIALVYHVGTATGRGLEGCRRSGPLVPAAWAAAPLRLIFRRLVGFRQRGSGRTPFQAAQRAGPAF